MNKQALKEAFANYDALLDAHNEALEAERTVAREILDRGGRVYKGPMLDGHYRVAYSDKRDVYRGLSGLGPSQNTSPDPSTIDSKLYDRAKGCWNGTMRASQNANEAYEGLCELILLAANETDPYDPLRHPLSTTFAFWDGDRRRTYCVGHDGERWSTVIAHIDGHERFVSLKNP